MPSSLYLLCSCLGYTCYMVIILIHFYSGRQVCNMDLGMEEHSYFVYLEPKHLVYNGMS